MLLLPFLFSAVFYAIQLVLFFFSFFLSFWVLPLLVFMLTSVSQFIPVNVQDTLPCLFR